MKDKKWKKWIFKEYYKTKLKKKSVDKKKKKGKSYLKINIMNKNLQRIGWNLLIEKGQRKKCNNRNFKRFNNKMKEFIKSDQNNLNNRNEDRSLHHKEKNQELMLL